MSRKIQFAALSIMTLLTLAVVVLLDRPVIDCSEPAVYGTVQGVQACTINGGK